MEELIITIDESGVGTFRMTRAGIQTSGKLTPTLLPADFDFPAGTLVQAYFLPTTVQDGFVRIFDPDPITGKIDKNKDPGDVLVFHAAAAGGRPSVCFYSDREGEVEKQAQFADIGVPNRRFLTNALDLAERGGESGFARYFGNTPFFMGDSLNAGQPNPNFDSNHGTVMITVLSDTPEPSTAAFSLCGGVAIFALAKKRKARSVA